MLLRGRRFGGCDGTAEQRLDRHGHRDRTVVLLVGSRDRGEAEAHAGGHHLDARGQVDEPARRLLRDRGKQRERVHAVAVAEATDRGVALPHLDRDDVLADAGIEPGRRLAARRAGSGR